MSGQIQDQEKTVIEALRQLYFVGLRAFQARRMAEIKRLSETRIAKQVEAQEFYDETVRQADANLEAAVGAAKAIFDGDFNPLRDDLEEKTALCKVECTAAKQAADAQCDAQRASIDEEHKLALSMAEEIYAVELESDSPGYEQATCKYRAGQADANAKRDQALQAVEQVRSNLHREANLQLQMAEQPARQIFDAGYKLINDVFSPINGPAQQIHRAAKRQAWDALEASRKACNDEECRAREDMELRFNSERRTRVMLWKLLEEELKRFSSVYS